MNSYLASFGPALANHLWQSTAFAAAAWLLTILLRKNSARVRYGVWLAASIKFLIPFSLLIALGGLLPKPAQPVAPAVYAAMKVTEQPFADISQSPAASAAQTLTPTQQIAADLPPILLALWLAGTVAIVIIWFVRSRNASICLHDAVPASDGRELDILHRLEARLSCRPYPPLRLAFSAHPTEPSVYGIFRPVLVWPERLSKQLNDEQIAAIMTHELMHARRFDNAVAALHMLVEAVFWCHPLVWWMEHRMIEERERACDETVVALGGSPDVYAESILKTCRFCVGSAVPCVAGVTGADLKKRVVNIMTVRALMQMTWPKKLLLGAAALSVVAAPVLLGQMNTLNNWEKAAGGKMAFEVASVKQDKDEPTAANFHSNVTINAADDFVPTGGLFSATNQWFTEYLVFAYKLTQYQYRSIEKQLPDSISNKRYDIEGRAVGNPTKDQYRLMMQSLLADRFKLAAHFEPKQEPVFALVIARPGKLGPQLRTNPESRPCEPDASASAQPSPDGFPIRCGVVVPMKSSAPGRVRFGARNASMSFVADWLISLAGSGIDKPVIDRTGLGNVDFTIEYSPEGIANPNFRPDANGPSFPEALRDQLGLKLVPTKASVETLVIDHIEEPSPN